MLASLFRSTQDVLWGEALGFKEKEDAVLEVFFFAMILHLKVVVYTGKKFQGVWTLRCGLLSALWLWERLGVRVT